MSSRTIRVFAPFEYSERNNQRIGLDALKREFDSVTLHQTDGLFFFCRDSWPFNSVSGFVCCVRHFRKALRSFSPSDVLLIVGPSQIVRTRLLALVCFALLSGLRVVTIELGARVVSVGSRASLWRQGVGLADRVIAVICRKVFRALSPKRLRIFAHVSNSDNAPLHDLGSKSTIRLLEPTYDQRQLYSLPAGVKGSGGPVYVDGMVHLHPDTTKAIRAKASDVSILNMKHAEWFTDFSNRVAQQFDAPLLVLGHPKQDARSYRSLYCDAPMSLLPKLAEIRDSSVVIASEASTLLNIAVFLDKGLCLVRWESSSRYEMRNLEAFAELLGLRIQDGSDSLIPEKVESSLRENFCRQYLSSECGSLAWVEHLTKHLD